MKRIYLVGALSFLVFGSSLVAAQFAPAAAEVGNCNTNRTKFRTSESTSSTTSQSFVNVAETNVVINPGSASCVIVVFSAESFALTPRWVTVRARIPGIGANGIPTPSEVVFGREANSLRSTKSMQFIFPQVPAGKRTIRMQFKSSNGNSVSVMRRTTTVHYQN